MSRRAHRGHREKHRQDLQDEMDLISTKVLFQRHHKVMVRMVLHPDLWGGASVSKNKYACFYFRWSSPYIFETMCALRQTVFYKKVLKINVIRLILS